VFFKHLALIDLIERKKFSPPPDLEPNPAHHRMVQNPCPRAVGQTGSPELEQANRPSVKFELGPRSHTAREAAEQAAKAQSDMIPAPPNPNWPTELIDNAYVSGVSYCKPSWQNTSSVLAPQNIGVRELPKGENSRRPSKQWRNLSTHFTEDE